jgi:hypothetical protein
LNRLASVLTPAQLRQVTSALANGTLNAALLTELVNQVQAAGACADSHVACRQLCADVLMQCVDCASDGNTHAAWVRTCNAL